MHDTRNTDTHDTVTVQTSDYTAGDTNTLNDEDSLGLNIWLIDEMRERWQADPTSVDASWLALFEKNGDFGSALTEIAAAATSTRHVSNSTEANTSTPPEKTFTSRPPGPAPITPPPEKTFTSRPPRPSPDHTTPRSEHDNHDDQQSTQRRQKSDTGGWSTNRSQHGGKFGRADGH